MSPAPLAVRGLGMKGGACGEGRRPREGFGGRGRAPSEFVWMSKLSRILVIALFVAIAGGLAFLAAWDIPPPLAQVEKVIPNERFPR